MPFAAHPPASSYLNRQLPDFAETVRMWPQQDAALQIIIYLCSYFLILK